MDCIDLFKRAAMALQTDPPLPGFGSGPQGKRQG